MTTSPLANPTATRELLEEFGLATKHRLGQNFLIDNHVIERICELAELAGDERVLEVGPGVGTLTLALLQEAACVTSIEADPELEPVLDAHAADYANFRFIMGDALKVGPEQIEQAAGGEPTVFVANLPYNVAATIICNFPDDAGAQACRRHGAKGGCRSHCRSAGQQDLWRLYGKARPVCAGDGSL